MKPVLVLALLNLALVTSARVDVPSAYASFVDPCLVLCPAGDITFHVIARNVIGIPIPGATVDLEYSASPGFQLCILSGSEPYERLSLPGFETVRVVADGAGQANFPVRAGGTCAAGLVKVYADGVLLAERALASPDQDGDGDVDNQDSVLLQSKLGLSDPTADLTCDGSASGILLEFERHLGYACDLPVGAPPATWGRLKVLYR